MLSYGVTRTQIWPPELCNKTQIFSTKLTFRLSISPYMHAFEFVLICFVSVIWQFFAETCDLLTIRVQGSFTGQGAIIRFKGHQSNVENVARWLKKNHTHTSTEYNRVQTMYTIDPSHKSHNASHKYPTIHYFVTEMCTASSFFITSSVAFQITDNSTVYLTARPG